MAEPSNVQKDIVFSFVMLCLFMCFLVMVHMAGSELQKMGASRGMHPLFDMFTQSGSIYQTPQLAGKRRNFARRALKMPLETRDRECCERVDAETRMLREAQREECRRAGIVSACDVHAADVQDALERMADFPQPDGSFVHIATPTKEYAGFWLDGNIEPVYHGLARPAAPVDVPPDVIARFAAPHDVFRRLVAVRVVRVNGGE